MVGVEVQGFKALDESTAGTREVKTIQLVSQEMGPQYRRQNATTPILGTPKKGTPNFGNP